MSKGSSRAAQEHLKDLLRQIRVDADLSQRDLARKLGQPQSFISKYESGERRLDPLELRQVCEAVGITLVEFARRLDRAIQS